jgi:hypothetical protein
MEKLGSGRRSFSLHRRPPRLYTTAFRANRGEVEIFEPYEENLPLESGYYTFVLDENGRFRVRRGNTSSHASFTRCGPIGGAGHFRINRAGNVAEVFCLSLDYRLIVPNSHHPTVGYLIDSFRDHHALEVSPLAIFRFKRGSYDTFHVSIDKELIGDLGDRLQLLEEEGQGESDGSTFTPEQLEAFESYSPAPPPRLYPMYEDQLIIALESRDEGFEFGPSRPRYAPDQPRLTSGKKAFVIDREGWLIFGFGHHILSGGADVGAAGQVVVEPSGAIGEINLNFSGHYRPTLDAEYARFTFRAIENHPLLTLSPDCRITGRRFDGLDVHSVNLKFSAEELRSDDPELDETIEFALL